jgi:hypothetical protein
MINTQDQEELFKLIANYLEKDVMCTAIGGTAMMFSGYKNTTKDIDLVFETENDRKTFVKAIEELGYREKTLIEIYDKKRQQHKNKPKMFTRGEERFDLFTKDVFGFVLDTTTITQRHDFLGKNELIIKILPKEELILLKAITGREKDHEDIETILENEKKIDWQHIIDITIAQKNKNSWLLIDLEETLQKTKKKTFIKKTIFEQIYKAQGKALSTTHK